MDRQAFLDRVREALSGAEVPPLPEAFPPTPASAPDAEPERFLRALEAASGTGELLDRGALAEAIARHATSLPSNGRAAVVSPDADPFAGPIDAGLAEAGFDVIRPVDGASWRRAASTAALAVTSARLGVAATGSVLVVSGASSPRAATILPEHHLVLMPVERLVASLEDAMPAIAATAAESSAPFLMTGPSRTSDIEMHMVVGAHGPRSVHVLLVR